MENGKFCAASLCNCCDLAPGGNFCALGGVTFHTVSKRSTHMNSFVKRGFLPLVIGATLLAGCATREAVQQAQASADAARMEADQANAAAAEARAAAAAANQRADAASSTANTAQQAANSAQQAANGAQTSAQNAAASAQRASEDARSAQQKATEIATQPPPPPTRTRFARGERG